MSAVIRRFATVKEAVAQGYRLPDAKQDKDISGPNAQGYRFEDANGVATVPIWLDEEVNVMHKQGAVQPMFAPR